MNHRQKEPHSKADPAFAPESLAGLPAAGARWLDSIDPGAHRRIKGLRLVTASASRRCWAQGRRLCGACLPLATAAPLVIWAAAALAMVIYAMALPEHLRCVRIHFNRHPRSQRRSLDPTTCLTRLGNLAWWGARPGHCNSYLAASHVKAVKIDM